MIRWIGAILLGAALGAGAVLLAQRALDQEPVPPLRSHEPSTPVSIPARTVTPARDYLSLAQIKQLGSGFERTAALYDLVRSADADAIEGLLEEAAALDQAWPKDILYSRYVELAPRAAVNRLLVHDGDRGPGVRRALLAWATSDLDGALAFVDTLEDPLRTRAVIEILNMSENLDRTRQDEIAQQFSLESDLLRIRVTAKAATEPRSAWQQALAMEPGRTRDRTLQHVAQRWVDQDPPAALAALDSVSDKPNRRRLQLTLLRRWVALAAAFKGACLADRRGCRFGCQELAHGHGRGRAHARSRGQA